MFFIFFIVFCLNPEQIKLKLKHQVIMSLSKCTRLFSLVTRQQQLKLTSANSLRILAVPRRFLFNKSSKTNDEENLFVVEKNGPKSGKRKLSRAQFYSAVFISSTIVLGTFVLFKWQLKDLLAKEDDAKTEVRI